MARKEPASELDVRGGKSWLSWTRLAIPSTPTVMNENPSNVQLARFGTRFHSIEQLSTFRSKDAGGLLKPGKCNFFFHFQNARNHCASRELDRNASAD